MEVSVAIFTMTTTRRTKPEGGLLTVRLFPDLHKPPLAAPQVFKAFPSPQSEQSLHHRLHASDFSEPSWMVALANGPAANPVSEAESQKFTTKQLASKPHIRQLLP